MLSISNLKMDETNQFKCEKCQSYFKKKEGLEKHLKRKFPCFKDTTTPEISIEVPQISTNHNEIVEMKDILMVLVNEIRTLKEEFVILKSICSTHITPVPQISIEIPQISTPVPQISIEIPQISTPVPQISIEIPQISTNEPPVVKKVKKVKKTPAPIKYTIVPPTTETEVDMSLSVQPVQQAPVLTTIPINENPIEYLTKTYEPTDTIYGNLKYICKDLQEEWFEKCEDDYLKFYIKDEKCREFIDKCSTIEKKEAFYAILFEQHLKYNYDLGVLSFYDYKTERLYVINEDMDWELSTTNTTNPIGCLLWEKLNTAVAFTAKFNPDLANDLFKIKHLVSKNEKINEIVKSVLSTLNYDKIRVSI